MARVKHLFVVHSNITYLSALGVICKDNLPLEDVVIISESYRCDTPVKCHIIDVKRPLSQVCTHPNRVLSPFKYADKAIGRLTRNEPFELYVTAFFHLQRICLSNAKCKGFHFIEEGLSNYYKTIPLSLSMSFINEHRPLRNRSFMSFLSDVLYLIKGYNSKIQSVPFLYNAYFNTEGVRFYGFDRHTFYGVERREMMDLQQVARKFRFDKTQNFDDTHIWLGTNVVRSKYQTVEEYIAGIEFGVVRRFKDAGVESVSLKFHPTECEVSRSATIRLFNDNEIRTIIIPDQTVMEIELMGAQNATLWGVDSSLMFYAAKMGVECYSIVNYLSDYYIADTPAFWEIVKKLER